MARDKAGTALSIARERRTGIAEIPAAAGQKMTEARTALELALTGRQDARTGLPKMRAMNQA